MSLEDCLTHRFPQGIPYSHDSPKPANIIYYCTVALVTQMLDLHKYLPQAKTDQEKRLVQQEIEATDVRIDALVYELYGLTAEEIGIIEGKSV